MAVLIALVLLPFPTVAAAESGFEARANTFVAYASADEKALTQYVEELKQAHDEFDVIARAAPEYEIHRRVIEGIFRSPYFVALIRTPNVNVGFELGLALGLGRRVVPVACGAKPAWWSDVAITLQLLLPPPGEPLLPFIRKKKKRPQVPLRLGGSRASNKVLLLSDSRGDGGAVQTTARSLFPRDLVALPARFDLAAAMSACGSVRHLVWFIAPPENEPGDGVQNFNHAVVVGLHVGRRFRKAKRAPSNTQIAEILTILIHRRMRRLEDLHSLSLGWWDGHETDEFASFRHHSDYLRDLRLRLQGGSLDTGWSACAVSSEGAWLATAHFRHSGRAWSFERNAPVRIGRGTLRGVVALTFVNGGQWLISGCVDRTLVFYRLEPRSGRSFTEFARRRVPSKISCVSALGDTGVLVGCADGKVFRYSLADLSSELEEDLGSRIECIHASADGDARVFAVGNSMLVLRSRTLGNGTFAEPICGLPSAVSLSPDGATLLCAHTRGVITRWSVSERKLVEILAGHTAPVTSLCWLDESTLATAGRDGSIRRWNVPPEPDGAPTMWTEIHAAKGREFMAMVVTPQAIVVVNEAGERTTLRRESAPQLNERP